MFRYLSNTFIVLLLVISACASVRGYRADARAPSEELSGGWINREYYRAVKEQQTPAEAFSHCRPVGGIIISPGADTVTVIWNFHESETLALDKNGSGFKTAHPDSSYPVYRISRSERGMIMTISGMQTIPESDTVWLERYPERFNPEGMPAGLANTTFLAGEYRKDGGNGEKIVFNPDGSLSVLNDYGFYQVGFDFETIIRKDHLFLYADGDNRKVFFWEIRGDTLDLTEPDGDEWFISGTGSIHTRLFRID